MGYTRRDCHIVGGNIIFGDTDIRAIGMDERRALRGPKIAYIAQSAAASFNPAHTLMEQVCEASVRHGVLTRAEARARAIQLFRELDLPDPDTIGSRYPHQVSGGQLQRVMAAMAMVAKPDILIFDEPTTALDVTTQVECLASFRKLIREHGTAALYITHDLAVVAQIADRIMVLKRGKMVEFGELRQILQEPKEEYTRRLVRERVAGHAFADANEANTVPILAIEHVSANYPGKPLVIDDVTLDVRKGDTVAVVGELGSGKSTLARVVTGLLPRIAGDVRFNGLSLPPRLKDRTKDQLRRVQMIYQMPDVALNPQHTLLQTIGRPVAFYFNRSRDEVRHRVAELLRQMDLPESFITRKTSELSGGQKQRVSIARALAAEPRPHHLRRGHLRSRSARRRRDPASSQEAAERAGRRLSLYHPRPRDREAHRQQGRSDAQGQGRGERRNRDSVRSALSSLYGAAPVFCSRDAAGLARRSSCRARDRRKRPPRRFCARPEGGRGGYISAIPLLPLPDPKIISIPP